MVSRRFGTRVCAGIAALACAAILGSLTAPHTAQAQAGATAVTAGTVTASTTATATAPGGQTATTTPTQTPTATATPSPTATATRTPLATTTSTPTATATSTATQAVTSTATPTGTSTATPTATRSSRATAVPSPSATPAAAVRLTASGSGRPGNTVPGRVLVRLRPPTGTQASIGPLARTTRESALRAAAGATEARELIPAAQVYRLRVPAGTEAEAIARLRTRADVLYAEEEVYVGLLDVPSAPPAAPLTPNDTRYADQWAPAMMRLPETWGAGYRGSETVTVGIIDTVIDFDHPEFAGRVLGAVNCAGAVNASACTTYLSSVANASRSHGTHVAGIAAAAGNNASGVAGVAWQVKIAAANVFDLTAGTASSADVTVAIDWMLTQQNIKVINLSLGGPSPSITMRDAIQRAYNAGVLVVAAAGNCGDALTFGANGCVTQNETLYPAAYGLEVTPQTLLPVAATKSDDTHASFSNQNTYVQLRGVSAPGHSILSTVPRGTGTVDGNYGYNSGTSMAAPYVTGLAALMFSANANLTPAGVMARLKASATDRGTTGADVYFGAGRVDALAAIDLALSRALTGTLSMRRAAAAPSAGHKTDFRLYVHNNGSIEGARVERAQLTGTTDSLGQFVVSLPSGLSGGTYDVMMKPAGAVGRERNGVSVSNTGDTALSFSQFDEGDADGSGSVTAADLNVVKSKFATTCASGASISLCPDFDRDGKVTLLDFSLLSRSYDRTGPTVENP